MQKLDKKLKNQYDSVGTVFFYVFFLKNLFKMTEEGMHLKPRNWLLLFAVLTLICFGSILLLNSRSEALTAEIYQDGILIQIVDLTTLTEPMEIRLTDGGRENIILAENGQISMHSANCPDRLCVKQGIIKNSIYPIVCLPHKVVIKPVSAADNPVDAVTN